MNSGEPHPPHSVKEKLVELGDEYFQELLSDIAGAEQQVILETYIYARDAVGAQVAEALAAAARRGVDVRLLIDGVGSLDWGGEVQNLLLESGANVHIYRPLPWHFWQWRISNDRSPFFYKFFSLLIKLNRRNHRKYCVIDRRVIWLGSMNICRSHCSPAKGGEGWRDTMVRVEGEDFPYDKMLHAFELAWENRRQRPRLKKLPVPEILRLNYTTRRRRLLYQDLLEKIESAENFIYITNAYFIPEYRLLAHLKKAALRGVDVRLILPSQSDVFFIPWSAQRFYEQLLKSNVNIYEYLPSILHAKVLIIDDWATVGSTNLNYRSLIHDLEVDYVVQNQRTREDLRQSFERDLTVSRQVALDHWRQRAWWKRWLGQLLLLIRIIL